MFVDHVIASADVAGGDDLLQLSYLEALGIVGRPDAPKSILGRMDVFFDLWYRLGNGTEVLTIITADEVEAGAAAEVAVLAASCRKGSSSPMAVVAESFAYQC
jgi:hypothetical protein